MTLLAYTVHSIPASQPRYCAHSIHDAAQLQITGVRAVDHTATDNTPGVRLVRVGLVTHFHLRDFVKLSPYDLAIGTSVISQPFAGAHTLQQQRTRVDPTNASDHAAPTCV